MHTDLLMNTNELSVQNYKYLCDCVCVSVCVRVCNCVCCSTVGSRREALNAVESLCVTE